jgi:serine/threonine protein kinase
MVGSPISVDLHADLVAPWPSFSPSEVRIYPNSTGPILNRRPEKVTTGDGETHLLKFVRRPDVNQNTEELKRYLRIKQHLSKPEDKTLLISRLSGLVRDPSEGTVLGLLLTYIDSDYSTLQSAVRTPRVSPELRQRWADQVRSTLARLHEVGIVWGDAKPENILIDRQDNAWITDFGGGYTEGWVDKELAETIEGDVQGLERIIEHIFTAKPYKYEEEETEAEVDV